MSDLPKSISINEEGPREGFQIEKNPIPTSRKIELIDSLSQTGLKHIQTVSFVNPKLVPGMADAEEVLKGIKINPDVHYTALWLNERGLLRAIENADRLELTGSIALTASEAFQVRNQGRTHAQNLADQEKQVEVYIKNNIPVTRATIMAAFGCNFEGDIPVSKIMELTGQIMQIAAKFNLKLKVLNLSDTMAWATPGSIRKVLGALKNKYPDLEYSLHLHDTRGMGIANAYAGMEMGVRQFDASIAGLGGCPFAAHAGAAGNVCTEDLVFMCDEMGIETGINLDAAIESARLAESIVGHPVPGAVMKGGSLRKYREGRATAAKH